MCGFMHETKKQKILIVDDEENNRNLLEALLRAKGYESRSASNGAEALEVASEYNPDLVLLDVMMPGINGFQVAEKLKSNPDTKSIPIIIMTALADRESRIRGLDAGAVESVITQRHLP